MALSHHRAFEGGAPGDFCGDSSIYCANKGLKTFSLMGRGPSKHLRQTLHLLHNRFTREFTTAVVRCRLVKPAAAA
jgi:hypothetical protein